MSEPFKVPEPSREAVDALRDTKLRSHSFDEVKAMASLVLRVDVPRIVRAEVERAWHWWHESDAEGVMPLEASFVDYLATRFPEAAPEKPESLCAFCGELARPAERIGRLERFCAALAKERAVGAEGPQGLVYDPVWAARRARADDEATAAAREYLRP